MPTGSELEKAHEVFTEREPRDLFYRVATELIDLARRHQTTITVVEALAVLLQTWNARYYVSQHHGKFPHEHFDRLEELLKRHDAALTAYRMRPIESLAPGDQRTIEALFADFESLLGAVGAAKALHLLAPRFFPLWDTASRPSTGAGSGYPGRTRTATGVSRRSPETSASRSAAKPSTEAACSSGWMSSTSAAREAGSLVSHEPLELLRLRCRV